MAQRPIENQNLEGRQLRKDSGVVLYWVKCVEERATKNVFVLLLVVWLFLFVVEKDVLLFEVYRLFVIIYMEYIILWIDVVISFNVINFNIYLAVLICDCSMGIFLCKT